MLKVRSFIQFCVAASIVLLPLAHLKIIVLGIPLYSVEIPILMAFLAYFYGWEKRMFTSRMRINFNNPLVIGAGLFFLGAVVSFVANPFSLTGLGMLKAWFVSPLLMAWLIFQLQPTEREKNFFLNTWLVTTLLVACGALAYVFTGQLTYDGRLAAWFLSPNYLAIFIAPGMLITFQKLQKVLDEKKEIKQHAFYLLTLLVFLMVLFFTHSYGVWFGIFVATLLVIFLSARTATKKNFWRIFGIIAIIATLFFSFEYNNPKWRALISFENRSSMASRVMIWQSAGKMIVDNPLFGIGLGRFQDVYLEYQKYYPPYLEWAVPEPHNIVLAVWLQTGLLGLFGFILLITRSIYVLMQNKNRESILLLGLLVLYLLYGLFDTPYFKTDLAFSFWLVIGFVFTLPKSEGNSQKQ